MLCLLSRAKTGKDSRQFTNSVILVSRMSNPPLGQLIRQSSFRLRSGITLQLLKCRLQRAVKDNYLCRPVFAPNRI